MKPAPASLVVRLLEKFGPETVVRHLSDMGYAPVSRAALKQMRAVMVSNGSAQILTAGGKRSQPVADITAAAAEQASDRLFDAIHALYQRRAREMGCSVKAAEYKLNFSRAQLEKMAS